MQIDSWVAELQEFENRPRKKGRPKGVHTKLSQRLPRFGVRVGRRNMTVEEAENLGRQEQCKEGDAK